MPTTRVVAVMILLLAGAGSALSESWTNQAGRVVEGKLGKFDGYWVTLIRTNGVNVRLPLSALLKADQHRVLEQSSLSVAPDFVLAAFRDALVVLERYNLLPPEEQTTAARKGAAQMACAVFDGRLRNRQAELVDKAVQAEVKRLRSHLAGSEK